MPARGDPGEVDRIDLDRVAAPVAEQQRQRAVAGREVEDPGAVRERRRAVAPEVADRAGVVAGEAADAGMQAARGPIGGPRVTPRVLVVRRHRRILPAGGTKKKGPVAGALRTSDQPGLRTSGCSGS